MKKPIDILLGEYQREAYLYFDQNIRELPRQSSGEFDESHGHMKDNDVDAFRHAYLSGCMTQIFF